MLESGCNLAHSALTKKETPAFTRPGCWKADATILDIEKLAGFCILSPALVAGKRMQLDWYRKARERIEILFHPPWLLESGCN